MLCFRLSPYDGTYKAIGTMDCGKVDQSWRRPYCHLSCKHVTDNYRAVCKQPSTKIRRGWARRRRFVAILRIVGEELITLSCLVVILNCRTLYHVMISGVLGVLKHTLLFQNFGNLYHFFFKFLLLGDRLCGLVVRVSGLDTEVSGSIPGATRFSE